MAKKIIFLIFIISVIFFSVLSKAEAQLTENNIKKFQSIKTVSILVKQDYDAAKKINLPFEEITAKFLKYAGLNIVKDYPDATITIEASGRALESYSMEKISGYLYLGAKLSVNISFQLKDGANFSESFSSKNDIPSTISHIYSDTSNAPFDRPFTFFISKFADIVGNIYGTFALINALKDDQIRGYASTALNKIDPNWFRSDAGKNVISEFILALKDKNWDVRKAATETLGEIGGQGTVEALILALKDNKWEVRYSAVKALGKTGDQRAVEPLISVLKDENSGIREAAARALEKIGDQRAAESLILALKDKNSSVREAAVWALGKIGDQRAVEPLISALKDENSGVLEAAARALGKIKDQRAVEPLISVLKDKNSGVRKAAVWALGKIGDLRAVESLILALNDENSGVRYTTVWALGKIEDLRAVESLISALKDINSGVREAAAWALGEIGDQRAIQPLKAAAEKDGNDETKKAAREALIKIDMKKNNR